MVRKRQRRRRLSRPSPPAASVSLLLLALYSVPLFCPAASPGSAFAVAAAAVAAAVSDATPPGGKQQSDAGGATAREPQRRQDRIDRSLSGGGIGSRGQHGAASVKRGLGDTEEELGRAPIGEEMGVEERQERGKPGHHLSEDEALLSQQTSGGCSSSSSSGKGEDETRPSQPEAPRDDSKDTARENAGTRPVRPPTPVSTAREAGAAPEPLSSEPERSASAGKACRAHSRGDSGSGDGGGKDNDRWGAQTLGVPSRMHRPPGGASDVLGLVSSRTVQKIGGTLPRVLEDSAWSDGEEEQCLSEPLSATAGNEREETNDEDFVAGRSGSAGLAFDSSRTAQTIGGTLPRVLDDPAWCAGGKGCLPAGAEKEREETMEEEGAIGGSASEGLGFDSARTVQTVHVGGTVPRILPDSAWCAGEEDCLSAGAETKTPVQPGPGAAHATCDGENLRDAKLIGRGQAGRDDAGSCEAKNDAASASASTSQATRKPARDSEEFAQEAVYPFSKPATSTEIKDNFPTVTPPVAEMVERQSIQEQRGPLVKGQGAKINTKIDARHEGGGDHRTAAVNAGGTADSGSGGASGGRGVDPHRRGPVGRRGRGGRGRDLSAESAGGGAAEEEEEEEDIVLTSVFGKARASWRTFACVLLLSGVALGMFLRGSLPAWLPFLGGDSREGWMIDLDSAIATARSRAGSFCSGRAGVFTGDTDDSDLPDLVSDDDDERVGDRGGWSEDHGGEVPLMWDTRPKPDDFLVFHPVLGVVPVGAVRAWGGEGRGGWSGGKVGRRGGATTMTAAAAMIAATKRGSGAIEESVLSTSSPLLSSSLPMRAGGDRPVSEESVVGGGQGKELPPVRNTEEWFRWLASREPAGGAPVALSGKEKGGAVTAELVAAEAPREGGSGSATAVAVPAEAVEQRGEPEGDTENETNQSNGRQTTTSTNGGPTEGSGVRKAAATAGGGKLADSQQQQPSDLSHTPAAISLQFGIGGGEHVCGGGTGGSGSDSTDGGLSRPGSGGDGEDSLGFSGGSAGGGGTGARCSSEDGSSKRDAVMAADYSPRRLSLTSAEQPPPMTAAYQVS